MKTCYCVMIKHGNSSFGAHLYRIFDSEKSAKRYIEKEAKSSLCRQKSDYFVKRWKICTEEDI